MNTLKPCPFCGGAKICTEKGINLNYCDNCSAESNIEHWNTRPIEDELNKRIAELEAFIDRLVELGNGMKSFLTPYVDGFRDSYPATSAWESLVKDWKEREE